MRFSSTMVGRLLLLAALGSGCASGLRFPWPARGPATPAVRDDVATVNAKYRRLASRVLVRSIARPSRASLDYAAYHANFMNADPAPEVLPPPGPPRTENAFGGVLAPDSLTGSVAATALSADERKHPLALSPLVELLASRKIAGADRLEDVLARIRSETWGLAAGPQWVRQTATLAFLHEPGQGRPVELWLKIELAPWFRAFSSAPDEDGDGVPEIYGRIAESALGDATEIVRFVRSEYEGRVLTAAQVKAWAHQLASYWYPSYNTDLVATPAGWPASDTEPEVRQELGALAFAQPTVVMRGKPQGTPVYNVFLVEGASGGDAPDRTAASPAPPKLAPSKPTPDVGPVKQAITAELAAHGGAWNAWAAELGALKTALGKRLDAMPAGSKALRGQDGFLFFGQSLAYLLGGDLEKQKGDRNPVPVIVEFQKLLARRGVDFLFVPVPTKVEVFPDKVGGPGDTGLAAFAGKVANPFERKLLLDLAKRGVETIDLLPPLLAARAHNAAEPLYQVQDTHWTTRGLELAATIVAERVRRYPWYPALARHRRGYTTRSETFARHGDLYARLPEAERGKLEPESLVGHQVVNADGTLYEDDPDSPIVLLGDSFTGVYQLMDCEHAGISAHLAKELGYPIDLVMSYGGGPNVREKLVRRGLDKLGSKKLVIWMMTARDLYDHTEGWQPLDKK